MIWTQIEHCDDFALTEAPIIQWHQAPTIYIERIFGYYYFGTTPDLYYLIDIYDQLHPNIYKHLGRIPKEYKNIADIKTFVEGFVGRAQKMRAFI